VGQYSIGLNIPPNKRKKYDMNNRSKAQALPPIDFYDAQVNVGDSYFVYTIQGGSHSGGGVSCYFWFSSAEHFFQS
jgi:hypothetical protein